MGGQNFELRHYYRAIARRIWLVALLVVLIAGGVYWRTTSLPPSYSAKATILVTAPIIQQPMSAATGAQGGGAANGGRASGILVRDIINLLSTRPVAERVTGTLGLKTGDFWNAVSVAEVRGTNLIEINARATNRALPARLANATAEQFIAYYRDVNRRDMREVRRFIETELAKTRVQLDASDRQIEAYKQRYQFLDMNTHFGQVSAQLADVRNERHAATIQLKEIGARLAASTARFNRENQTRVGEQDRENNPVFQQLESRLTALEVQKAELSQRYTPLHPRMQTLAGEIESIRTQLKQQSRYMLGREMTEPNPVYESFLTSIANLEVERAATAAKLTALTSAERTRAAALLPLTGVQRQLAALMRDNTNLALNYTSLAQRHQEAVLRESEAGFMPAGVQVVERAVTPSVPVNAGLPLRVGIGALVGLLLGAMAAIVLETGDDRIRSPQDAERALGVPVLVAVPDMTPQRAPGGAVLVLGFILFLLVSSSLVVGRATTETVANANPAMSVLVRVSRGIDGLTTWLGQAVR